MARKLFIFFWLFIASLPFYVYSLDRVVDNAGLLSDDEKASLNGMIRRIADRYQFDLVIVTEKSIGSCRPVDYADDYFDYNGYGFGDNRDGCLFLQVTGSRDHWFNTSGRGIGILKGYAFETLEADAVKFLKDGNPYRAYISFLQNWEKFLSLDAAGKSFNFVRRWHLVLVLIAWIAAIIAGFAVIAVWRSKMNTVLPKTQAAAYIVPGSLSFREKKDRFLYSTVTKSARPKQSASYSGGGGSHTGSSGRSHGGGGGRY